MTDHDAVRAWIASFGGAITAADYADEMIDAGYDSLDNMIFTKDELMDACEKLSDKLACRHAARSKMMSGM